MAQKQDKSYHSGQSCSLGTAPGAVIATGVEYLVLEEESMWSFKSRALEEATKLQCCRQGMFAFEFVPSTDLLGRS